MLHVYVLFLLVWNVELCMFFVDMNMRLEM